MNRRPQLSLETGLPNTAINAKSIDRTCNYMFHQVDEYLKNKVSQNFIDTASLRASKRIKSSAITSKSAAEYDDAISIAVDGTRAHRRQFHQVSKL